jgi:hypothetical protein
VAWKRAAQGEQRTCPMDLRKCLMVVWLYVCMLACRPCNVVAMNARRDTRIKTCRAAEGSGCRDAALWQWCCSDVGGSVATTVPEEEGSGRVPTVAHRGLWHPPCSGSERHHAELISTSATRRGRVVSGQWSVAIRVPVQGDGGAGCLRRAQRTREALY